MSFQTRESLLESMADGKLHSDWLMSERVLRSLERDGFVLCGKHVVRITPAGLDYIQNWHGPRFHALDYMVGSQPEQGSRARVR